MVKSSVFEWSELFDYRLLKRSVFEWIRNSNVRYMSPDCYSILFFVTFLFHILFVFVFTHCLFLFFFLSINIIETEPKLTKETSVPLGRSKFYNFLSNDCHFKYYSNQICHWVLITTILIMLVSSLSWDFFLRLTKFAHLVIRKFKIFWLFYNLVRFCTFLYLPYNMQVIVLKILIWKQIIQKYSGLYSPKAQICIFLLTKFFIGKVPGNDKDIFFFNVYF